MVWDENAKLNQMTTNHCFRWFWHVVSTFSHCLSTLTCNGKHRKSVVTCSHRQIKYVMIVDSDFLAGIYGDNDNLLFKAFLGTTQTWSY